MPKLLSKLRYFDIPMLICLALLSVAGLAILYSTSLASENLSPFWRQIPFLSAGFAGYFFLAFFDYHSLAKANRVIYVILVAALIFVLFFGEIIRGGRRWINLGVTNFQVAELAKLVVILGLARLLSLKRGQINSWLSIGRSLLYAGIPAGLIILEPDMGSALIVLAIWAGMLLISPVKKKFLAILFLAFAITCGLTWKFVLKDFQKDRVMVFINPNLDPKGRGYNVQQATIAVGSGWIFGRGLGNGLQSQNKFLPERQTDFIFAAGSEEIGFLGASVLLLLYLFLFLRLIKIMRNSRDDLGMYLAGGVFFLIFWHVIINVGMNIGLLPVTGVPLPFLSSGGSSLVIDLLALGIVQNVAMQSKVLRF